MEQGFWGKLNPVRTGKPIMAIAPMSGVTDEAFRLMFLRYGKPDIFWTEFVSAEGLFSKGREYCLKILKYSPKPDKSVSRILTGPSQSRQKASLVGEKPIVAQIFGCNPADFEKAAALVAELGFDGVDINMGCPDKAIEKQGAGCTLIKNPALAKEIIRATKRGAGKLPVSIKTRLGYNKVQIAEWIGALLEEEPAAIEIHFRTRKELYFPPAHWELAKEIVALRNKISPKTLILGNGNVESLEQAKQLAKENGLDGIMIGRAVVGDPWFFSEKIPTLSKRLNAIVEHAEIFEKLHKADLNKNGRFKQFEAMKKHFHASTKGFRGAKELRDNLMKTKTTAEVKKLIKDFLGSAK